LNKPEWVHANINKNEEELVFDELESWGVASTRFPFPVIPLTSLTSQVPFPSTLEFIEDHLKLPRSDPCESSEMFRPFGQNRVINHGQYLLPITISNTDETI
jgi:hypothetical protein